MEQLVVKFNRYDRDPDGALDHNYGAEIDAVIDELAGGRDRLARGTPNPSVSIPGVDATVILHEDGPEIRFGPLPGYPDVDPPEPDVDDASAVDASPPARGSLSDVLWPLAAVWMKWPKDQLLGSYPNDPRFLRIEFRGHRYEGRPVSPEQLDRILDLFRVLGPTQPQPVAQP